MVGNFYKDYPKKSIVISVLFDFALPMAKPTVKFFIKQKQTHPAKDIIKHTK